MLESRDRLGTSCSKGERPLTLPVVLVPHPHVRVEQNVLGGSPYVLGSRVPVRRLWAFYSSGVSVDRILKRYPQLGPAKVFDALAFALDNPAVIEADVAREAEILAAHGQKPPKVTGSAQQIELPFAEAAQAAQPARSASGPTRKR